MSDLWQISLTGSDLFATSEWSTWREVCRPEEREILHSQRCPSAGFPVACCRHCNCHCCNASLLRRHQRGDWSFWDHASWLHFANDLLQYDFQAVEAAFALLGKHYHCCHLLCVSCDCSSVNRPTDSAGRKNISPLCECMKVLITCTTNPVCRNHTQRQCDGKV